MQNKDKAKKRRMIDALILLMLFCVAFFVRAYSLWHLANSGADGIETLLSDEGQPYLIDPDSYFFMRNAELNAENGFAGDELRDGQPWSLLRGEPNGQPEGHPPLTSWLVAFFYRLLSPFQVSPYAVGVWFCAVAASLSVIPAYFFARNRTNRLGGVVAALAFSLSTRFVAQTLPARLDTDALNVLLPLLVLCFLSLAVRADKKWKTVLSALLCAGCTALFSLQWSMYYYVLALALLFCVVYIPLSFLVRVPTPDGKTARIGGAGAALLTFAAMLGGMVAVSGFSLFQNMLGALHLMNSVAKGMPGATDSLPETLVSISELQKLPWLSNGFLSLFTPNNGSLIGLVGGVQVLLPCAALLLGMGVKTLLLCVTRGRCGDKAEIDEPLMHVKARRRTLASDFSLFLVWLFFCVILVKSGARWAMLLSMPLSLLTGLCAGRLSKALEKCRFALLRRGVPVLCAAVLLSATVPGAVQISLSTQPSANGVMRDAMRYVRNDMPEDTALFNWWDYGYYYEYESGHHAVMDGGYMPPITVYYTARAFLTENGGLANGIARMLIAGGQKPHTLLADYFASNRQAARVILQIVPLEKEQAYETLTQMYFVPEELAKQVTALTHPETKTPYAFVFSSDLMGKAGWLSFFSSWDFQGNGSQANGFLMRGSKLTLTSGAPRTTHFTLANGDSLCAALEKKSDGTLTARLMRKNTAGEESAFPADVVIVSDRETTRETADGSAPYTLAVLTQGDQAQALLMSANLARSYIVRTALFKEETDGPLHVVYEKAASGSVFDRANTILDSGTPAFVALLIPD